MTFGVREKMLIRNCDVQHLCPRFKQRRKESKKNNTLKLNFRWFSFTDHSNASRELAHRAF